MWKKDEEQPVRAPVATAVGPEPVRAPAVRSNHATIGPSIVIRGEVSGNEDLLIEGRVDGSVALDTHAVTVGGGGRVQANISGRVITIEGDVKGDLSAKEQIVLRGSAKVLGDIKAPRVVLEDGASFRGLVDMGTPLEGEADKGEATTPKASSKPLSPPAGGSSGATKQGQAATGAPGPSVRPPAEKGTPERRIGA